MRRGIGGTLLRLVPACVLAVTATLAPSQEAVDPDEEEVRLARAAERFEQRARVLTLFDRDGNVTGTVGGRAVYLTPALSPDGKRIAVVINDFFEERSDLWVVTIETGERIRLTDHPSWDTEWDVAPVWSADASELVYVGMRDGYEGIYRQPADGRGEEELLYRHPGANLWIGDWSPDKRLLSVSTTDLVESYLYLLQIGEDRAPELTELLHKDSRLMAGNFSPDGRYLSYRSEETGINEIYLWDLEAGESVLQVSEGGGLFQIRGQWDRDRNEIYYLRTGEVVVAAKVDPGTGRKTVERTALFELSSAIRPGPIHTSVSRNGERMVVAVPHVPTLEQVVVLDRQGNEVQRLGEPGVWRNPVLSPDGTKVAVQAWMKDTSFWDIRVFDRQTGASVAVTADNHDDNYPIWSPDGSQLAYRSLRDEYSTIYRKPADGTGAETKLFTYEPGAFLAVTDWSRDGRFVSFNDGCWGVLYVVPLEGDAGDRRAMEWLRDEYQVALARFSPDNRYIAYLTDEVEPDVFNLYIAPFDPNAPNGRATDAAPLPVSADEVLGMVSWREDGHELYYLSKNWTVMAVEVSTESGLEVGEPRALFEVPGPLPGEPRQWKSASPDGQRFVFVLNVPVTIE